MKPDKKKRIEKLEQAKEDSEIKIVVNWDPNPDPPGEGVRVVTWDDVEDEHETD